MLGLHRSAPSAVAEEVRQICRTEVPEDGLRFDLDALTSERIREHAAELGVRVRWMAYMGSARISLQIDVGYGDAAAPSGVNAVFPTLLDLPAPNVLTYPPEFSIAEKLQAIVERGLDNSRLKDYFDIAFLAARRQFDGSKLRQAIDRTFEWRETRLPDGPIEGLTPDFAAQPDRLAQWAALIRRIEGEARPLEEVVERVAAFAMPVLDAVRTGAEFSGQWLPGGPWKEPEDA